MIETNGPANMIMMLDTMLEMGTISTEDHGALKQQAERTINYLKQLDNPSGVQWFNVK